ncbi:MAG TPA: ABC transporter permease [Candidatus Sulfotelmatobacter sp.]|nr:ABC transporter permease [Candidatus Sulfotelmatobacter sp.]
MTGLVQDLRYALRQMGKTRGFAAVAIITLALGIGANTLIFTLLNGVLFSPLPFPNPDQLVTMHENKPNFEGGSLSYPNFRDWQSASHSFSAMAIARTYAFSLTRVGEAEQVNGEFVSSFFFSVLGVNPVQGRTFMQGEDEVGAAPVALVSEDLWQRKFSSSADVLGKTLTLDAKDYTIVGVIPASFHLRIPGFRDADVFVPIGQWANPLLLGRGAGLGIHGIARLKPGVSLAQARADMETVSRNLAAAFPDADKGISAQIVPLKQSMVGHVGSYLSVLMVAVGFVLLIACANVGSLLLARSAARTREFAVRTTLGASVGRVIQQLVTESILLALAGGAAGLVLTTIGMRAILGVLPSALPRSEQVVIDRTVLLFTATVSIAAGIFFGLAPVFKIARSNLQDKLKEIGRGASGVRHRMQDVFVISEMALAVVLLIGAGLTIRSLMRLWSIDPGFNPHNVLTFGLSLSPSMIHAKPDAIHAAFRDFDARLASIPGVRGVSQTWGAIPFDGDDEQLFWLEGQARPINENDMNWVIDYIVEPDYLQAMQIPLQRGRFFTSNDNERSPLVVVIDDVFAQRYFPSQDPVGKRIYLNRGAGQLAEIIGVVGHVRQWGLDADDHQSLRAEYYLPCLQMPDDFIAMAPSGSSVVLRSDTAFEELSGKIRLLSAAMSSEQVIYGTLTMDSLISRSLASRRFSMILLVAFASLAILLASVGIYGLISYIVAERTHEIGVRVALGARRSNVFGLILGRGGKLAAIGVAAGLVAALGLSRLMVSMLYGISPADPFTFLAVAAVLMAVALAACYLPAQRATKVDPAVALRCD